ncbi:hypothetical protein M413DRAFT_262554 [Hebeloma cylindrosporum]|uniref:Uncharacterized protein n=1 Tax=Hebeloma cylindrosporum TaxID=76867 RepID=A0A0C2Z0U6_HEBCY|nr:hypothetical protein M413DRAFT_262554 [Hebeloma cylindrosporum h7]
MECFTFCSSCRRKHIAINSPPIRAPINFSRPSNLIPLRHMRRYWSSSEEQYISRLNTPEETSGSFEGKIYGGDDIKRNGERREKRK